MGGGTLVWLNGPHGVGKTHTAHELVRRVDGAVLADPEHVGFALRKLYPANTRPDYRELSAWREATTATLIDVLDRTSGVVIAPQTITDPVLLDGLLGPLRQTRHRVEHLTLMVSVDTLRRRLCGRGDVIASFAQSHAGSHLAALSHGAFARHIDAETLSVAQTAEAVARLADLTIADDSSRWIERELRAVALRVASIRLPWA